MPLALLIAIVAVVLLAAAAGIAWYLGYPLRGIEPVRASATEAGERAADLTADFLDWVRLGR